MKIKLRELRRIIRRAVNEMTKAPNTMFNAMNDPLSPSTSDREQLGFLADHPTDVDPNDDLPDHLKNPVEDPEQCWGPVPPTGEEPYTQQDPFTRDTSPNPTPGVRR